EGERILKSILSNQSSSSDECYSCSPSFLTSYPTYSALIHLHPNTNRSLFHPVLGSFLRPSIELEIASTADNIPKAGTSPKQKLQP
ncbi:hypothetical protein, partial [Enterobacter cloacae]|uniref:hypothetical protein n=1 Tax=Enterobacter cloacae TaxID=550 RepID=UPI00197AC3A4